MAVSYGKLFNNVEYAFTTSYIVMLSTGFYFAFSPQLEVDDLTRANESTIYLAIWVVMYVGLMGLYLLGLRKIPSGLYVPLIMVLSTTGTYLYLGAEQGSVIKFVTLIFTILFGCWAAARLDAQDFYRYFFGAATVIAIVHLSLYPALAHLSVHFDKLQRLTIFGTTSYAGLFAHKNNAGGFFAIAFVMGLARALSPGGRFTFITIVGLILQFVALGLSGAVSPLISATVAILLVLVFVAYALNKLLGIFLVALGVGAGVFLLVFRDIVLETLNRDSTYTGRTYLYSQFWKYFSQKPLTGYGYGEAFNGTAQSIGTYVNGDTGLRYAHYVNFESGFLQCAIDGGLVWLALYFVMFWRAARYSIASAGIDQADRFVPIALLSFVIASSANEVFIVLANTTPLVILVFLFAKDPPLLGSRIREQESEQAVSAT